MDLVDSEVFQSAQKVISGFRNRDCKPALSWCGANRSRLRRSRCINLEMELRVQQFIEMLKENKGKDALQHARKYFKNSLDSHLQTILHAMGAVAFLPISEASLPKRYGYLFEEAKWSKLEQMFRSVLFKINGLSPQSTLSLRLQAGLEALKTPHCVDVKSERGMEVDVSTMAAAVAMGPMMSSLSSLATTATRSTDHLKVAATQTAHASGQRSSECPVCAKGMYKLAENLSTSHRTQSCIVCRMCGEVMDENNPPLALPNGNVYSHKALEKNIKENNGKILDPSTGDNFSFTDAKPVFIM